MSVPALTDSESEQAIIGAALVDNSVVVRADLSPDDFSAFLHQRVWAAVRDAVARGEPITATQLGVQSPEMAKYLTACADFGHTALLNVPQYVATLRDLALRRRLKFLAEECARSLEDGERPAEETLAEFVGAVQRAKVGAPLREKRGVSSDIADELMNPPSVYSTGLPTMDDVLGGGLFSGKMYGFAARKKVGKTILLGTISHNLNAARVPHLFIAMEMTPDEIEHRNIARVGGFNSIKFLKRDDRRLPSIVADYATTVPNATFYEHCPGSPLDHVRRVIGRAIIQHQIKGIIVDYWQLVGGKERGETEEYHLRNVAQSLADICRREKLWCCIAAQVNQDGNTRGGEGLKLACDVYFTLHREKHDDRAWLEMEESRYVLYANVGSELAPGLILNKHGPYFEDAAPPPAGHWTERADQ